VGTPRELYNSPANLFVAQFIGSPKMNVLSCTTDGDSFSLAGGGHGPFAGDRPAVRVGVRPEHIRLVAPGKGHADGKIDLVEYHGADLMLVIDCGADENLTVRVAGDQDYTPGQAVGLEFPPERTVFFDETGQRIA